MRDATMTASRTYQWDRNARPFPDQTHWSTGPVLLNNTQAPQWTSTGPPTVERVLAYPVFEAQVSATNPPTFDFIGRAEVFYYAVFDIENTAPIFDPFSADSRILGVTRLEPQVIANPQLAGSYYVRWRAPNGLVEYEARRKGDPLGTDTPSVNSMLFVYDLSFVVYNSGNKGIVTRGFDWQSSLWSRPV